MDNRTAFARLAALAALLVIVLAGRQGRADVPEPAPVPRPRLDLSIGFAALRTLTAPPGTLNDNIGSGALAVGCSLDERLGSVVFGANADAAMTFNQSEWFLGVHAGYARDHGSQEIAVIPEAGAHVVTGLGQGFLTESDSPSATLPYAGLKLGVLHKNGPGRPDVGLWLFLRGDLAGTTVVAHTTVFTDHHDVAYDVGGTSLGVAFRTQFGH